MSDDKKAVPAKFSEPTLRDIELILFGALCIKQTPEKVAALVTKSLLTTETGKLFDEVSASAKQNAMTGYLYDWFSNHSIVLKQGEDLLTAIVRRLSENREQEMLRSKAVALNQEMRNGSRESVVAMMKAVLQELGELPE